MSKRTITLQPYPAYKPSGVPSLGDVPAHWDLVRLGHIGSFSKGIGGTKEDEVSEGIPCIRYGDLYTSHKYHIQAARSFVTHTKATQYTPILYGDILFAGSGETIEEIGKSAVNLIQAAGYCGGDVVLFRPHTEMDARFSGYAIDCPQVQYQKSSMGRGITVMHIYGSELKYLYVALPPLSEQAAIARYLDHVDRHIERYVAAKQKLVALLEEQKQAIIHRAVTRGLDPNVPLKPSGVQWLGDVPKHWERCRLKTILQRTDQRSTTGEETLLSLRRDHGIVVYAEHFARPSQSKSLVGFKLVSIGQLVVNRLQANNGLVFNSTLNGLVSPDYSVFKEKSPLQMQFLSHLLRTSSYRAYFRQNSTGLGTGTAGFLRLYDDTFLETPVYLPTISEQSAIVEYLDNAASNIDSTINCTRHQIDLMQEYRTSLIADVVTGKLDVREAAEQLPDESGEEKPIGEDSPTSDARDNNVYDTVQP